MFIPFNYIKKDSKNITYLKFKTNRNKRLKENNENNEKNF